MIVQRLKDSNMNISLEKSNYYKKEVEFLGYIVAHGIIKTDPKKIEKIRSYPEPKNLRQLRNFLGITGYYRKLIQDYAKISKPLTKYLTGESKKNSLHMSKKIAIEFDAEARNSFNKLKNLLSDQVELAQPDFNK